MAPGSTDVTACTVIVPIFEVNHYFCAFVHFACNKEPVILFYDPLGGVHMQKWVPLVLRLTAGICVLSTCAVAAVDTTDAALAAFRYSPAANPGRFFAHADDGKM